MIQLNYYYQTDLYQVSVALLNNLRLDNFDTDSIYSTGLILSSSNKLQPINKNILLEVNLTSLEDVLIVKNFEDLLTVMNNSLANQYVSKFGRTLKFGDKYVKKYMSTHNYKALKVNKDNILIIYDKQMIDSVQIYG